MFFLFLCSTRSYGMRYIAKVLKSSLHEKFPDATEDELLKVDFWGQTASSLFFYCQRGFSLTLSILRNWEHQHLLKKLGSPWVAKWWWKGRGRELVPQPSYLNLDAQQFLWKTKLNLFWTVTVLKRLEFIWVILGFSFVLWSLPPAIISWRTLVFFFFVCDGGWLGFFVFPHLKLLMY